MVPEVNKNTQVLRVIGDININSFAFASAMNLTVLPLPISTSSDVTVMFNLSANNSSQ